MAVADLISNAQGYAQTVLSQATSALNTASSAIQNVGYTMLVPPSLDNGAQLSEPVPVKAPQLNDITLNLPTSPGDVPTFQDIANIDAGYLPTLGASAPSVTLPVKPSGITDFSEAAPTIDTSLTFPDPPPQLTASFGDAPTLGTYTVPTAPSVAIPGFTAVMPTDTTVAPTDLDVKMAGAYNTMSPQMTTAVTGYVDAQLAKYNPKFASGMAAIEAQLEKYLAGGTGLNASVEDAIYERARQKNNAEANRVRSATYDDAASRGFTMPNGALLNAMQSARQAAADNNATAAREIVVMQAEMEQKNLQFALNASSNLRTTLVNATMMYMQNLTALNAQALDYAKSVVNAVVETYNVAAKVFGMKLEAYKTDAQVYEIKMRGALAAVELYRAEIGALEALVNVDRVKVEVYKARIESMQAYASLYRSQIDAVLGRAQLEKLKMEIYQYKVQAYTAQVQAKNAEWQGYSASVEGEMAKVKMFGAQVEAFNAQVNGYKAQIEAKSEVVRAQAVSNQAKATQYEAKVRGYAAVVAANADVARTKLENERQKVEAFKAETSANIAQFTANAEYYKTNRMVAMEQAKVDFTYLSYSADNLRKYGEAIANLGVSSAKVYGDLAGAAVSGMTTLAAETLAQ